MLSVDHITLCQMVGLMSNQFERMWK